MEVFHSDIDLPVYLISDALKRKSEWLGFKRHGCQEALNLRVPDYL